MGNDWVKVAHELDIPDSDINIIKSEYPDNEGQQAMVMLRFWLNTQGNKATGNALERALRKCDREDIINKCIFYRCPEGFAGQRCQFKKARINLPFFESKLNS